MKLQTYLQIKQISVADFARHLGITRTYLSRIVHGKSRPTDALASRISQATIDDRGEAWVTIAEVLDHSMGLDLRALVELDKDLGPMRRRKK